MIAIMDNVSYYHRLITKLEAYKAYTPLPKLQVQVQLPTEVKLTQHQNWFLLPFAVIDPLKYVLQEYEKLETNSKTS